MLRIGYLSAQAAQNSMRSSDVTRRCGADLKNAFAEVSSGCLKDFPSDACPESYETVTPSEFAAAMRLVGDGARVRLEGVTGDLSFSAAGDRMSDFSIWKTEEAGTQARFFFLQRLSPAEHGIALKY